MSELVFVLVHSPLVGPLTWKPVARELAGRGKSVVVPVLTSALGAGPPYWRRHSQAVERDIEAAGIAGALILVGHSGAGPLLPCIAAETERTVAGYLFADASIPEDGKSRFELFGDNNAVAALRATASGGLLPAWNEWLPDGAIDELVPDPGLREQFLQELRPTPLMAYEEPLPVFSGWPDAPCAYLKFSPAYDREAARARELSWPVHELIGSHLQMLAEPAEVTNALLGLVSDLQSGR